MTKQRQAETTICGSGKTTLSISADPFDDIRGLYNSLNAGMISVDCGKKCAPFNASGMPFCCDIRCAVPAVHHAEWNYLKDNTDLWKPWNGSEGEPPEEVSRLQSETPEGMILLACKGPAHCQRRFRSLSCRQFPFFPYVTGDYRFLGLAYEWEFEEKCWVISNLHRVSLAYRRQFVELHDNVFAHRQDIFDNYAVHSERMRAAFMEKSRRIPLLHRNGGYYLVSPVSERMTRVNADQFPRFGPYR